MEANKRVFTNTLAQYTKALINTCLSLYTVRLILTALGQADYGIYSLIAGVISLLGFIQNALVVTTQRYLSYQYGKGNREELRRIFSNSFLLHLVIGVVLASFMLIFKDYLCEIFLNIDNSRRKAALLVYTMSVCMMFTTFITAPFKALFIARENIVFISVIEVLDGILKFTLAIILLQLNIDKLVTYAIMMMSIIAFEFFTYLFYSIYKFEECQPRLFFKDYQQATVKKLAGFAGWTTYGMAAVILRTQGMAILLNKFFGTVMNAAYGIANQAYGAVSFVSSSILNAMNPQIMKAEGRNERKQMLNLAAKESKFTVVMLSILFIPLIVEMDAILKIWLGTVPPYASFFTQCLLISLLIDQTTYGLHTANQAMGNIKIYTLLMYTPKLLVLPISALLLYSNLGVKYVMWGYLIVEFAVAMARLPYLHQTAGLDVREYAKDILARLFFNIVITLAIFLLLVHFISFERSFLVTVPLGVLLGTFTAWHIALNSNEKEKIKKLLKKQTKKQ